MGLNRTCFKALIAVILLAVPVAVQAQPVPVTAQTEDDRLMALFQDDQRRSEALNPFARVYRGEAVDPAAFDLVYSDETERRALASARTSLTALARIDRRRLSPERQISCDVFQRDTRETQAWLQPDMRALIDVRPFNHFGGLHVEFPAMMAQGGAVPYQTEADYRRNLLIDQAFPHILDRAVLRFRTGLSTGVVESRLTVTNMIAQIDALLAQPVSESPFHTPVVDFPEGVPAGQRAQLRADYDRVIGDEIYPAYRRLRAFLADEYLPAARTQVGLSAMRGGAGLYRRLIESNTTQRLDPDAVHRLGLTEVARIQREMDQVRGQLGHPEGTLREFFDVMRSDPRFHPSNAAQLADGFAQVARTVDAQVPRFFLRAPRTQLQVQPYPEYRARYEAGGSYSQGSEDGTRPGTFFYNTYDLPSRFLTGIDTLYLHEGAPGHHFQISLAQENTSLPDFQRFGGNTAYVEGWALYAETLGYEMGLYADPMQHWGTLDDEMLRAMRLVVDTGLHAKGWSREQAIDYMLANSGMGRSDATAEVERYIAIPGQALAYKIGALTIQRLRREAETALGARFDVRQFHEQVLGSGALPMPVLEAKVRRWIAAEQAR
jgi:uncharacterized protein (DUF885 family)